MTTSIWRRAALALLLALPLAAPAVAQQPPPSDAPRRERPQASRPAEARLPADVTTHHQLALPDGRTLAITATAGSLPLVDEAGKLQAEIALVSYALDPPADGPRRPVTFAVNGGPGASSAFLNIAAIGPWRLPLDGASISPSAPPVLVPNAETWLDFTDLVFLDPVGTGYSRAAGGDDAARRYYEVDADASMIAAAIARWLRTNDRLRDPKFFVGESYGGFRGPLVAHKLQDGTGVGLSGLVLLSPVLDFAWLQQSRHSPWIPATRLPSLAAAALERQGRTPDRAALAGAEAYAAGDYLADLLRGPRDAAALDRVTARVAALTGLPPDFVRRQAGRPSVPSVQRELDRSQERVASAYDPAVTGWDPDPGAAGGRFEDPVLTAMEAPLASAMVDHLQRTLGWRVTDLRYEVLNGGVNRQWRWGSGREAPEVVSDLRQVLALDGKMRVMVAHGASDLVTPYFASKLILDQLPAYGDPGRFALAVFPGGHMFYSRAASRAAFHAAAATLYGAALESRAAGDKAPEKAP